MAPTLARKCLIVGLCGLITIILGAVIGWVIAPKVIRSKVADVLQLKNNTESWDRWKNLPVPIQYRLYIFQVNNPEEIMRGAIPEVTEVGPYVYTEERIKNIVSLDEEESTVTYDHRLKFKFDPVASAPLREDDKITVVNVPSVVFGLVVDSLKKVRPVIKFYNTSIHKIWPDPNPIFINVSAGDYLFKGIPILCNHTLTEDNVDSTILCEAFKLLHPRTTSLHAKGKDVHDFAFFKYKNETSDGLYKIDLGIQDITQIGQILSWNNLKLLSLWKGERCNRILGTDTTVFRPYLEEENVKDLYIFHTDVCRSIKLSHVGETEFKGVKGRRYNSGKSFLASVLDENENHCFCPQSVKNITHYGGCLYSGALELSGCQGVPIVVSSPHFLNSDRIYQDNVKGLSPDPEKHEIFLDLEPNTGYPLRGASRIQINTFLKSIKEVESMKHLPNVLIPTIWLEESVELTDELIDIINSQLLIILRVVDAIKWLMIACGALMVLGSCAYYLRKTRHQKLN